MNLGARNYCRYEGHLALGTTDQYGSFQELKENRQQGIIASPEMCLKHEEFRRHLVDTKFEGICAVIVDEMHCISQWGGDFRKAYGDLSKLRAFFPPHIPISDVTARLGLDTPA